MPWVWGLETDAKPQRLNITTHATSMPQLVPILCPKRGKE